LLLMRKEAIEERKVLFSDYFFRLFLTLRE
jgi:hypothetical protein